VLSLLVALFLTAGAARGAELQIRAHAAGRAGLRRSRRACALTGAIGETQSGLAA
jgi:hypothetical protein